MKKKKKNDKTFEDYVKAFSKEEKYRFEIMLRILTETRYPLTENMYEIVMNIFTKNNQEIIKLHMEEKEKEGLEVTKLSILKEINGFLSVK